MDFDSDGVLMCPACGFNYLHQNDVEVFNRGEDEPTGLHAIIQGDRVVVNSDITGNPSSRRQGLLIYFRCEGCPAISVMSIVQHKGNTYIKMDVSEEADWQIDAIEKGVE